MKMKNLRKRKKIKLNNKSIDYQVIKLIFRLNNEY